jgi:hypothetical protein
MAPTSRAKGNMNLAFSHKAGRGKLSSDLGLAMSYKQEFPRSVGFKSDAPPTHIAPTGSLS